MLSMTVPRIMPRKPVVIPRAAAAVTRVGQLRAWWLVADSPLRGGVSCGRVLRCPVLPEQEDDDEGRQY